MSRKVLASLLALIMLATVQAQESSNEQYLYVTDQLRLSLYKQADSRSKVIQLLGSGDKLAVEEIAGPYAKVITPAGNRGWVKRGFLVSEPTASLMLVEMEQKNELLKRELKKFNGSKVVLDQYEKDMDAMSDKITILESEIQDAEETIADLIAVEKRRQEKASPVLASLIKITRAYWQYILLAMLLILIIGYVTGKTMTEASVKKKFHGIKVW